MYLLPYTILEKNPSVLPINFTTMSPAKIDGVMKTFGVKLVYFSPTLVGLLLAFLRKAHGEDTHLNVPLSA